MARIFGYIAGFILLLVGSFALPVHGQPQPDGGETSPPSTNLCKSAQVEGPSADANFPGDIIYHFTGNQPQDLGNEFFCQWVVQDDQGNEFDVRGAFGCVKQDVWADLNFSGNYPAGTHLVITYTAEKNGTQICQRTWEFSAGQTPKETGGTQQPINPAVPGTPQNGQAPTGLVPCGGVDNPCTFCHFFKLLENILDFIVLTLVPIVGTLLFAIGGLLVMTAGPSTERVAMGKRILLGVFIGAIIVYASWVIIDSFLTFLVNPEVFPKFWFKIQCP